MSMDEKLENHYLYGRERIIKWNDLCIYTMMFTLYMPISKQYILDTMNMLDRARGKEEHVGNVLCVSPSWEVSLWVGSCEELNMLIIVVLQS